ncbi:branched-chain amino acid ABC transporter permease [Geodermatophilus ruber]|uniref:Amino acid/amide ABC transporter membrane protein 1, HAAT family n=1 Tax=Geodermatophilus ruber TaxID=504800 RepID=A0A1I4BXK6_9ACTN|nr:branched-chain amino acid ABC transporter permease [Geodermatophilus ruber]SFK73548.1 amino acid/amide ABC transporter membrane protein 1, HAAT family [Geodermatophilus ruber]
MTLLLQQILSGIATGVIFGGLALALSVVFEGTGVMNFAQGEMAAFTTFLFWTLLQVGLPYWAGFVLVIAIGFVLGLVVERTLIRPVENSSELTILIVTLALFLAFNALSGLIWGFSGQTVASPFGSGAISVFGARITYQQLGMTIAMIATAAAVGALFRFTNLGLRLRAAAMNRTSSHYLSINTGVMLGVGWGIAAATGAVAGAVIVPLSNLQPDMFTTSLLLAFAAFALGGAGSRVGAVVGGIIIGVVTNLGVTYVPFLSGDISDVVPLVVILLVLLLRPQGLFGRHAAVRS